MWFKDAGVFDNNDLGDLCRLASLSAAAALATTDITCVDFQSLQSGREQLQLLRARRGDRNSTPNVLTVTRLRDEVELISSATVHVLFHGGATCVICLAGNVRVFVADVAAGTRSCLRGKGVRP